MINFKAAYRTSFYLSGFFCAVTICVFGSKAHSQQRPPDEPLDMVLAFAVDVSGSVDEQDYKLQTRGIVNALTDPNVFKIISQCNPNGIALTYIEWDSGTRTRVKMTKVRSQEDLDRFAAKIDQLGRISSSASGTRIGYAIQYATREILRSRLSSKRLVIDVSGDGDDDDGHQASENARSAAVAKGITINGLVILDDISYKNPKPLDRYYMDHVIGGEGSFVQVTATYTQYAEAIKANIIRDVCPLMM